MQSSSLKYWGDSSPSGGRGGIFSRSGHAEVLISVYSGVMTDSTEKKTLEKKISVWSLNNSNEEHGNCREINFSPESYAVLSLRGLKGARDGSRHLMLCLEFPSRSWKLYLSILKIAFPYSPPFCRLKFKGQELECASGGFNLL